MSRRVIRQPVVPQVAVADLASYTGRTPVYVPGVGAVERVPGTSLWAPVDVVRSMTLVDAFDTADLDPADANNVVTGDLPAGWSLIPAETGLAKLTANGIELWSGDGTAVTAESSMRLQRTLDAQSGLLDRTVIVAQHAAADDGALGNTGPNNILFSVDWRMNGVRHVYTPSGCAGGGVGTAAIRPFSSGAASVGSIQASPRSELWEEMVTEWGSGSTACRWVKRPPSRVVTMYATGLLTADAGANRVQWVAGNANVASTAIVKMFFRSALIFKKAA